MKLQKKLISLIAAGLLVFGAAACDGDGATDDDAGFDAGTETDTGVEDNDTLLDEPTEEPLD